jgi:hypothetical protein
MSMRLNIVVSCSNRKAVDSGRPVRLRDISRRTPASRVSAWWQALKDAEGDRRPAGDVYVGEQWSVVRRVLTLSEQRGWVPRLWVCSAGYGLIDSSTDIVPYSATFAANEPDSVIDPDEETSATEQVQGWWSGLAAKRRGHRITTALSAHRGEFTIMAVSLAYLRAVESDVVEHAASLRNPDRLLVICAGASQTHSGVSDWLVPCDGRLRRALGGTLSGLNVRILEWMLNTRGDFGLASAQSRMARLMRETPALDPECGKRLTDDEVVAFIRKRKAAIGSASGLLRALRDSGKACEQSRFSGLYAATVRRQEGGTAPRRTVGGNRR